MLSIHVTCSLLLSTSLHELFPESKLLSSDATEKYFFCDVVFPFEFKKEMFSILEHRMREWVKKNTPIRILEMIPSNAREFLKYHGNLQEIPEDDLVEVFQLDHWAGLSPGIPLKTTGQIKFFKLLDIQIFDGWIRIIGSTLKGLPKRNYSLDDLSLVTPCKGGYLWLPRGEILKQILIEKFSPPGFDRISTPALDEKSLSFIHGSYPRPSLEWIKMPLYGKGVELMDPSMGTTDRIYGPKVEQTVISFLQIITKFLKIFTFDFEVVRVGKPPKHFREALQSIGLEGRSERGPFSGIVFRLEDRLGRKWDGPRIWIEEKLGKYGLSLFHSIERFVALLLDQREGQLPFWLQPEQVRLIALNGTYAEEIKKALEDAGFRVGFDTWDEPVAKRQQRALRERIPFSIVLGDREKKNKTVSVRDPKSGKIETMDLITLIDRLKTIENQ